MEYCIHFVAAPEFLRLFEIKDVQLSPVEGDVLCGIAIFKMSLPKKGKCEDPDFYEWFLKGLEHRVEQFKTSDFKRQKLQVYVADNVWDILHKEGILKANHVNFIRMATSSDKTFFGQAWRSLVHTNLDYPYTYIDDTDVKCAEGRQGFPDNHLGPRLAAIKAGDFDLYASIGRRSLLEFERRKVLRHIAHFKTGELSTIRGPRELLFQNVVSLFSKLYGQSYALRAYNSLNNTWTLFNAGVVEHLESFHIGYILPYIWRMLKVCYQVLPSHSKFLETKLPSYYMNRMFEQFEALGNRVMRDYLE